MRSLRVERRWMLGLTIGGFIAQTWMVLGDFMNIVFDMPQSMDGVTRFFVIKYVFAWLLWFCVLGACIWELRHIKRHYSRTEWGSSLQTLDTFDTTDPEDANWAKADNGTFVRGAALGYRDPRVTPYRETYSVPLSNKAYDLPPDDNEEEIERLPVHGVLPSAPGRTPAWKSGLSRDDYILGPDVGPSTSKKLALGSAYFPYEKYDPTTKRIPTPAHEPEARASSGVVGGIGTRMGK